MTRAVLLVAPFGKAPRHLSPALHRSLWCAGYSAYSEPCAWELHPTQLVSLVFVVLAAWLVLSGASAGGFCFVLFFCLLRGLSTLVTAGALRLLADFPGFI